MEEASPQRERRQQKCQNAMGREAKEAPNKQRFLKAERKNKKAKEQRGCN